MKIAVLGDSITEGVPGVSYVDMLTKDLPQHDFTNYGKGGDTVLSLHKRIKKIDLSDFDKIILFVGVNDLYSTLSFSYKILKTLMRQNWSKNLIQFEERYTDLLEYLTEKDVIVVPPLLMGEDVTSKWNNSLSEYSKTIKKLVNGYPNATFLDIRQEFITYLAAKKISNYIPIKLLGLIKDVNNLKTTELVDLKSQERGLHLMLDGIHINSKGARILCDSIQRGL